MNPKLLLWAFTDVCRYVPWWAKWTCTLDILFGNSCGDNWAARPHEWAFRWQAQREEAE